MQEAVGKRLCSAGAMAGRAGEDRGAVEELVAARRQRQPRDFPLLSRLWLGRALRDRGQVRRPGRNSSWGVRRSLFRAPAILGLGEAQARLGGSGRRRRSLVLTIGKLETAMELRILLLTKDRGHRVQPPQTSP